MSGENESLQETTVEELVARWPAVEALLLRHGIDTCCGGTLALEEAARAHEVPVEQLTNEIRDAIATAGGEAVRGA